VNGELAQTMALAAHGSAWLLRDDASTPPDLLTSNSTFQYVHQVTFVDPAEPDRVVDGVVPWLAGRRERHVERLWLVLHEAGRGIVPEHNAVAFAGGGTWALLATSAAGDAGAEAWKPRWHLDDRNAPDHRIWDIELQGARLTAAMEPPQPGVADSTDALVRELTSIRAFSAEQQLDGWTEWFDAALAVRDAPDPVVPYNADIFPASHPVDARRLAAMAAQAWVFGGMGSWNDLGFEAPDVTARYDELSRRLYTAVLHATVAATNVDLADTQGGR
jgi:hypothetical protein